jgi:uncharacterized protein YcgI (DUF1989 family)
MMSSNIPLHPPTLASAARPDLPPSIRQAQWKSPTWPWETARTTMVKIAEVVVPPRDARAFRVLRGQFFRIVSIEGPQVGGLNLWNADNLSERFFSGKTRALHATHVAWATGSGAPCRI